MTDLTSGGWQILENDQRQGIISTSLTSPREERGNPAPLIVILFAEALREIHTELAD